MVCLQRLRLLAPEAVRRLIRSNQIAVRNTSGMAEGFNQANIVILHKSLAVDFEKFCHANSGPLPLLYRSAPGEWRSPPLSSDSDIRTDCLTYRKYENGKFTESLSSLKRYSEQLKDMVTFYLGCSFSFESAMQKVGVPVRNVEQKCNVSMYKTSVPCFSVASFRCPLVVTMRPVPEDKLDAAVRATHPMQTVHGAPVHIGSSDLIGIKNLSTPDFGDPVQPHPGDVPVFWACGVTGVEAVSSCKSPLAFTHSPGAMFITDIKNQDTPAHHLEGAHLVHRISTSPLHYSIATPQVAEKIRTLEAVIGADPGGRGVKHLFVKDDLLKACLSLSHATSVLITTGFPTHFKENPPEETDGPPGAIAMAAMLHALGKDVSIVSDRRALDMNQSIIENAVQEGVLKAQVPLLFYQHEDEKSALRFLCKDGDPASPRFQHLVAIERAGMAADGNYYNARKINIKHLVDPIDELFLAADTIPGVTTTGIGDGGNELGMGKVKDAVKKHIAGGDIIACDVAADFAITTGVSNWGGYAVACGLYLLNTCEMHERYLRRAVGFPSLSQEAVWRKALPSIIKEDKMLSILVRHGVRSGKTGTLGMEVDGLPFYDAHSSIIQKLLDVTLEGLSESS